MEKKEELKMDIQILKDCVKGIHYEILVLQKAKPKDHVEIARRIKEKTKIENQLEKKTKELVQEEYKESVKPSDQEEDRRKVEFIRMDSNYGNVRSSYPKSLDN